MNLNPFRRGGSQDGDKDGGIVIPFVRPRPAPTTPEGMARLIEGEIIPRLLLAHDAGDRLEPRREARLETRQHRVELFAARTISDEFEPLLDFVLERMDEGDSFADVCFELLAPAARLLGEWWSDDRCTFADVTVGLCRLQQIVHEVGDRCSGAAPSPDAPLALFTLPPGDQHAFGLTLAAEFFRHAGWRTVLAPDATADELGDMVRRQSFDLIAFSVLDERRLASLTDLISDLRQSSCNAAIGVLVGGRVFDEAPNRATEVGADVYARDPDEALKLAEGTLADIHHHFA